MYAKLKILAKFHIKLTVGIYTTGRLYLTLVTESRSLKLAACRGEHFWKTLFSYIFLKYARYKTKLLMMIEFFVVLSRNEHYSFCGWLSRTFSWTMSEVASRFEKTIHETTKNETAGTPHIRHLNQDHHQCLLIWWGQISKGRARFFNGIVQARNLTQFLVRASKFWRRWSQGRIQGRAIAPPPTIYKCCLFHHDFLQFGKEHSRYKAILPSVVLLLSILHLSYSSEPVMRLDWQILLKLPPKLTGWIRPWLKHNASSDFLWSAFHKRLKRGI